MTSARARVGLVILTGLTASASVSRWHMESNPRKYWNPEARMVRNAAEYCPDGMAVQIELFAQVLRGRDGARQVYARELARSHQSSTYLIGWLAAPLVLLGMEPAVAFVVLSSLASLALCRLLFAWAGELWPGCPRTRALALVLFLAHPATLRCFSRPQTDGLLAFFALASLSLGRWSATRGTRTGSWLLLALGQTAACFVKVHALSLLLVPPVTAWLHGARGRRLAAVAAAGTLLPALAWALFFAGFGLYPTIAHAWRYKDQFYGDVTPVQVTGTIAACILPLVVPALLGSALWRDPVAGGASDPSGRPGLHRGAFVATALLVLGFAAILAITGIPPKVRFQYPALAPLVLCAVMGASARAGAARGSWLHPSLWLVAAWFGLLSAAVLGMDLLGRYVGPPRALAPLDAWLIHLF